MQCGCLDSRLTRLSVTRMPPGKEADFGDSTVTYFPMLGVLQLTDPLKTLVCPAAMVSKLALCSLTFPKLESMDCLLDSEAAGPIAGLAFLLSFSVTRVSWDYKSAICFFKPGISDL